MRPDRGDSRVPRGSPGRWGLGRSSGEGESGPEDMAKEASGCQSVGHRQRVDTGEGGQLPWWWAVQSETRLPERLLREASALERR